MSANCFRCPPLSSNDKAHFQAVASQTAQELLRCAVLDGGSVYWKQHAVEENLQVFEGVDGPTGERAWCAKSQIQAFVEEVHLMSYTTNTDDYKSFSERFTTGFIDAARLYNVVEPTTENPLDSVSINWLLQKSPSKGLIRNRDWCFVEGQFETKLNGRRAWVRSFKSIHLASCPDLQVDCGFLRGKHTRSGIIFLETDRLGYLDVIQIEQSVVKGDTKGKLTGWLHASNKVTRFRKILELEMAIRQYRLTQTKFLPLSQVVPHNRRSACHVCAEQFGKTSKKLNCRVCGEVICRECSKIYDVKIREDQWAELRVCEPCVFGKDTSQRKKSGYSSRSSLSSDDCIREVNLSVSQITFDETDDEFCSSATRDTLVDGRPSRPSYNPALADKFSVDSFFSGDLVRM